jgi:hypothetical protein
VFVCLFVCGACALVCDEEKRNESLFADELFRRRRMSDDEKGKEEEEEGEGEGEEKEEEEVAQQKKRTFFFFFFFFFFFSFESFLLCLHISTSDALEGLI